MLPVSRCPHSPLPQCLGRTLQLPKSLLGPGGAGSPADASPLPLCRGGRAGAGEPAQPRRGRGRERKGRACSRLRALPRGPGDSAGLRGRDGQPLAHSPPTLPPPPALDRLSKPAGAGPGRPEHSPAGEAALPRAAPSAPHRPNSRPREKGRCRRRRPHGEGGGERGRGTPRAARAVCRGPSPSRWGRDPAGSHRSAEAPNQPRATVTA